MKNFKIPVIFCGKLLCFFRKCGIMISSYLKWGFYMLNIMTAKEAATKWNIAPRRVNELIREGRIKGVYKIGAAWVMPADTRKPPDLRKERTKKTGYKSETRIRRKSVC